MKRKRVIILMASVFAVLALLLLATRSGDEVKDPIAFYYMGPTNGIPGSPIISCIISNKSDYKITTRGDLYTMQYAIGSSRRLHVRVPSGKGSKGKVFRDLLPGGTRKEVIKIPGSVSRHLLNTNEFKFNISWYSGMGTDFAKIVSKLPWGRDFAKSHTSTSETYTNSPSAPHSKDDGEN